MITLSCLIQILFINAHADFIWGEATKDGRLIYIERHEVKLNPDGSYQELKTEYLKPDQQLFATLHSNFEQNPYIPNSSFEDKRFSLIEKVKLSSEKNKIEVQRKINNNEEKNTITHETIAVMGQGFHNFIVKNFESILKNQKDVEILIPTRSSGINFNIKTARIDSDRVDFQIVPKNIFLKAIVPTIFLTYDRNSKKLLTFEGLSNLSDDKNNGLNVKITYDYSKR